MVHNAYSPKRTIEIDISDVEIKLPGPVVTRIISATKFASNIVLSGKMIPFAWWFLLASLSMDINDLIAVKDPYRELKAIT
ncbi:MAG: hypothetical protein ACTS73_02625 [Arsenophonus sp. NEOnobi-MAG3]